jgi:hypothetical protein
MSAIDGNDYDFVSARPTPGAFAMSPRREGKATIYSVVTRLISLLLFFASAQHGKRSPSRSSSGGLAVANDAKGSAIDERERN